MLITQAYNGRDLAGGRQADTKRGHGISHAERGKGQWGYLMGTSTSSQEIF